MKIAFILSRVPYPLTKGDRLRAYHQIRTLSEHNKIYLYSLVEGGDTTEAIGHLSQFCEEVNLYKLSKFGQLMELGKGLLGNKPFQVHYFFQKPIAKRISDSISKQKLDAIYFQTLRTAEYAEYIDHDNKVLDYMDAFSAGMKRRITKNSFIKKLFVRSEYKRLKNYEQIIFKNFNAHCIISKADKNELQLPSLKLVLNGVDTDYFLADNTVPKKYDLLFVGNMNYPPNIDCCEFIVHNILPQLDDSVTLMLAGINPHQRVKALASDRVIVTGYLEDIRTAYNQSKIFLAPLQIGRGLQNKILEALAMDLPCIVSDLAYAAFGQNSDLPLVSCNEISDYIIAINNHLQGKTQNGFKYTGREFVLNHYNWKAQNDHLLTLFKRD